MVIHVKKPVIRIIFFNVYRRQYMKKVKIIDLKPGIVNGIDIQLPASQPGHRETYFEWTAFALAAGIKSTQVSGGVLKAWHHVPVFKEIETHIDTEMFYFVSGTALMLFMDIKDGKPDMETSQVVRIQPGTQLVIPAGKGHFVAVAEDTEPVLSIVIAPRMDAPRISLSEPVEGI